MHAYAANDPVFLAMNQRGQRETAGALGDFCVKCHAPVAVAEGLTTDGLNLAELPAYTKGVTCYFCHSAASVTGTHNNPLTMAMDDGLFGPFGDPVPGTPHKGSYSPLFDLTRPESAQACGSCHDIVNQHGAAIERTYQEWQGSLFSDTAKGQTCVRCHMNETSGPASSTSPNRIRRLRGHAFPGVDVALTAFPNDDIQIQQVQDLLDFSLQESVCLTDKQQIEITLENAGVGHGFPSGATQDRRLWIEVTAWKDGAVVYQSGAVPPGQSVETIDDPDLWLIRDCMFDAAGAPVHQFWEAVQLSPSNQVPASVAPSILDPTSFTRGHLRRLYPSTGPLSVRPDRITLTVHIKPIGDDVLASLVASKDLDPAAAARVPRFTVGGDIAIEWTPAKAKPPQDDQTRQVLTGYSCVKNTARYFGATPTGVSHAQCQL